MGKIVTFLKYSVDFAKYGQFRYILSSIRYILTGKTTRKTRYYRSSLGKFIVRAGSLDFQFANYAYEWNVKKVFFKHFHDYNVFLDIGSNIGTYSILMAKKGLQCIAFEPVKSNIEALKTNIRLNNLEAKICVMPVALGAKTHSANFTFDPVNTGASHLTEYSDILEETHNPEFEDIKIEPLDKIVNTLGIKPDDRIFIKIDVEGMEINVLEGAVEFIKSHPHLFMVLESKHSGKKAIKQFLDKIGNFEYILVDDLNMAVKKLKD